MKIAIDVSQMAYSGTGVGRYVRGLAEALLCADSPHEFIFYAGALRHYKYFRTLSKTSPWNKAKWIIRPLPPKLMGWFFNTFNTPFERLTGPADLLHTSDWSQPFSKIPTVTTVHDLAFRRYPKTIEKNILRVQTKRLDRIVKFGSSIVADSLSTKKDLIEFYKIDESKITVIYPGISPDFKRVDDTLIEQVKIKYEIKGKYLLTLGTKEPRKNLARTAQAFAKLRQNLEYTDLSLVITGRVGWGEQIPVTTSEVISTGYIDDGDLPALYSGASAFVYPSLYEGFGFPVLEAMACGIPVVTSNLSSLPEVAGDAGVLMDPTNVDEIVSGLKTALTNIDVLSKRSLAQASKFSWRQAAKQMIKVYEIVGHK